MIKYIPNILTLYRLIGAIIMIGVEPFSDTFYTLFITCGITDMLDGWIARKFDVTSELGSRLDTVADVSLMSVSLIKIARKILEKLPRASEILLFVALGLRALSYIICAIKFHKMSSVHSYLGKTSMFLAFFVPLIIATDFGSIYGTIVVIVFLTATLEEILIHLLSKEYSESHKSIFLLKKESERDS